MEYYKGFKLTKLQIYVLEKIDKYFGTYEIYGLFNTCCLLDIPSDISEINVVTDEAEKKVVPLLMNFYNDKVLDKHAVKPCPAQQDMIFIIDLNSINSSKLRLRISRHVCQKAHIIAASLSVNNKSEIKSLLNKNPMHVMDHITNQIIEIDGDFVKIEKEHGSQICRYTCFCLHKNILYLLGQGSMSVQSELHANRDWSYKNDLFINILKLDDKRLTIEPHENCAICQEKLTMINGCRLHCDHVFHFNCLEDQIIEIGNRNSKCCLCNKEIYPLIGG